jgi:hypothetical protein
MEVLDPLFGVVALEEDMDQSQERLRDVEWVNKSECWLGLLHVRKVSSLNFE